MNGVIADFALRVVDSSLSSRFMNVSDNPFVSKIFCSRNCCVYSFATSFFSFVISDFVLNENSLNRFMFCAFNAFSFKSMKNSTFLISFSISFARRPSNIVDTAPAVLRLACSVGMIYRIPVFVVPIFSVLKFLRNVISRSTEVCKSRISFTVCASGIFFFTSPKRFASSSTILNNASSEYRFPSSFVCFAIISNSLFCSAVVNVSFSLNPLISKFSILRCRALLPLE